MEPEDPAKLCPKCKSPVHKAFWDRHVASCVQDTWNCPVCTFENTASTSTCTICTQGKRPMPGRWNCKNCTFENPSTASKCQMCGSDKSKSIINREKLAKKLKDDNPPKEPARKPKHDNLLNHREPKGRQPDNIPNHREPKGRQPDNIPNHREPQGRQPDNIPNHREPKGRQPDSILNRREDKGKHEQIVNPRVQDMRPDMNGRNARQGSINEQYRVDARRDEDRKKVGPHSPSLNDLADLPDHHSNEPEIDLYDIDDSDELDIIEKNEEPMPAAYKHRVEKDEEKSDERIEDIDFLGFEMDKPKKKAESPPQNDAESIALIQELLKAELCSVCTQQQGYNLHSDGVHRLCAPCGHKYLMRGLKTQKWKSQALTCPVKGCDKPFPQSLITNMQCSEADKASILELQDSFCKGGMRIICCPKCDAQYEAESASALEAVQKNFKEFGLDNKALSKEAVEHKGKCRFRCPQCATIFCGDCREMPYHLGFTCEGWEEYQNSQQCRFCGAQITDENLAPFFEGGDALMWVCRDDECLSKRNISCGETLPCGHLCRGIANENSHPRCLDVECNEKDATNGDDYCNICWVEGLAQAPCVELECGHFFHYNCIQTKVSKKWPAARITFKFMDCPLCNKEISHPKLKRLLKGSVRLKREVAKQALERLRVEGLDKDERIKDPNSKYYRNQQLFALDRLAFYICFKCKQPYFGGMRRCEEAGAQMDEKYNEQHLVCGSCASGPNSATCKIHGKSFITYKCKFCCSIANWFCWGNTHFCTDCHKKQEQGDYLNRKPISALPKCPGRRTCPLGLSVEHPANGTAEFSLGCVVCLRK